jgi:hypothetical protein
LWLSLDFLLRGRKLRNRRQATITLLGTDFLLNAALSFYAFVHDDIRYSQYQEAFRNARWGLNAIATLMIIAVFLIPKKKQGKNLPASR